MYANQQGCDGDRLYYDGCCMIIVNGNLVAQGSQFSLNDVEVVTATVDIEEVRSYRCVPSRGLQANQANRQAPYLRLELDYSLSRRECDIGPSLEPSDSFNPRYHLPEEEIAFGPACWLWDYLRRSGSAGFFVPLSGGIDSCAVAVIVYSMCREVMKGIEQENQDVISDVRRLCAEPEGSQWLPKTPQEVCKLVPSHIQSS